jgi:DNA repair protein RadD
MNAYAFAPAPPVPLRPYQRKMFNDIFEEWAVGHLNVLAVLPTGLGKSRLLTAVVAENAGGTCVFAHRMELVYQLCATMNEFKIPFRIIAQKKVRTLIIAKILKKQKVCYHDTNAKVAIASVGTLIGLHKGKDRAQYAKWLASVTLWVGDELHHGQGGDQREGESFEQAWERANQWGKVALMFPRKDIKGLGVTATPKRGDGGGLSRESDGFADVMVVGPTMLEGLRMGYLNPYKIFTVPCTVKYDQAKVGAKGEFTLASLEALEDEDGHLVGDIVENYLKYAPGKKGVCFVSSVGRSRQVAAAFLAAGVRAAAVDGTMETEDRDRELSRLESGAIDMVVNCDLLGEGVDLPALEVVILGTATNSLGRYMQRVGRLLRLGLLPHQWAGYDDLTDAQRLARIAESPKPFGILIDHGSNIIRFDGPPEAPHREWTMGRYKKSVAGETVPYRVCANPGLRLTNPAGSTWEAFRSVGWTNNQMLAAGHLTETPLPCAQPYERVHKACPHCGFYPEPQTRVDPEHVEGDLEELTEEKLQELYATIRKELLPIEQYNQYLLQVRTPNIAISSKMKQHRERLEEVEQLRKAMGFWGGWRKQQGDNDSQMQRRFFHLFGVDVLSAQALKRADAEALRLRITDKLLLDGIDIAEYDQGSNQ